MKKSRFCIMAGISMLMLSLSAWADNSCTKEIRQSLLTGQDHSCSIEKMQLFASKTLARTGTADIVCDFQRASVLFIVSPAPDCNVSVLSSQSEADDRADVVLENASFASAQAPCPNPKPCGACYTSCI